ncbi:DUF1850 domain-containing protein [Salinisphaera sp.]|uniref:DUF1850 domain-containing protein n=1 Tax=Salinisphaera sp. TaxID=1914330 RepID=UPI000C4A56BD|nr:DUF1850 domain-containing protein [Salinisphaera sp.]MBS63598.1 hypothetical protein [Salinisphaera sp.]
MRHFRAGALGICGAFLLALAGLVVWPRTWLVVRDADGLRYAFVVQQQPRFSLAWTHSVEKENWVETFHIDDQAIVLASTRFKTFGAGVPAEAGHETRLKNGWVVMDAIDRVVDPLAVQAAAAEGYRMRYGGRWFALSRPGKAPILTFAVRRAPVIAMWRGMVGAWRAPETGKP